MLSSRFDQRGFTLIELLVTMMITGILLTLGAFAARQLWLVRSLSGAQNEVVSQLQQMQERTIAASHPLVFGVRFPKGGASSELSTIGLIRFDPGKDGKAGTGDDECIQFATKTFDLGVQVDQSSAGFDTAGAVEAKCKAELKNTTRSVANDWFAFFYARGNATAGEITVEQPALNRKLTACVAGITGRVSEKEGGSC